MDTDNINRPDKVNTDQALETGEQTQAGTTKTENITPNSDGEKSKEDKKSNTNRELRRVLYICAAVLGVVCIIYGIYEYTRPKKILNQTVNNITDSMLKFQEGIDKAKSRLPETLEAIKKGESSVAESTQTEKSTEPNVTSTFPSIRTDNDNHSGYLDPIPARIECLKLPGTYKVGKDIPAGEYKIDGKSIYYIISSEHEITAKTIIGGRTADNQIYITVEDGQYLKFQGICIMLMPGATRAMPYGSLEDGVYKVGFDIRPGRYKLTAKGARACYTVRDSSKLDYNLIHMEYFEGETYVSVKDGDYLELSKCTLVRK